jgi:hypothetical protein
LADHDLSGLIARHFLERALTVYRREWDPEEWAGVTGQLGLCDLQLYIQSGRTSDAERAKTRLADAASTFEQLGEKVGATTARLNLAYVNLQLYAWSRDPRDREAAASQLKILSAKPTPFTAARVRFAWANLHVLAYDRDGQAEDATAAELHLRAFLRDPTVAGVAAEIAKGERLLGNLHRLKHRIEGWPEAAARAREAYHTSVTQMPEGLTSLTGTGAAELAAACIADERWEDAHKAYERALDATWPRYVGATDDPERRRVMRDAARFAHGEALCLIKLGRLAEAVASTEKARARIAVDAVGLLEAARAQGGEEAVERLRGVWQLYREVQHGIDQADVSVATAASDDARALALDQREERLGALDRARGHLVRLVSELGHQATSVDISALAAAPIEKGLAIVSLVVTEWECGALILYDQQLSYLPLPDASLSELFKRLGDNPTRLASWRDAYTAKGDQTATWEAAMVEIMHANGGMRAGWLPAYSFAFEMLVHDRRPEIRGLAITFWSCVVKEQLAAANQWFWQPLLDVIGPALRKVVLIPSGPAAALPLHFAPDPTISVTVAPSITLWVECEARHEERSPGPAFAAFPAADLPFAAFGAQRLKAVMGRHGLSTVELAGKDASVRAVAREMPGNALVAFLGHASSNLTDTAQSKLMCSDGTLTLAEIRQTIDLSATRLVVLGACETGLVDLLSGDEFIGLPMGLIEAGAPAVVASLWPVSDLSSAFLLDRCVEEWAAGAGPAAALRLAAEWLRTATRGELGKKLAGANLSGTAKLAALAQLAEEKPFADPFHWAAFVAYGATR